MDQTRGSFDQQVGGVGPPVFGDAPRSHDRGAASGADEGIGSLVSGLIGDLQDLIRGEVRLARAELREDVKSLSRGVGMLAAGAFVGLTGFIFLMLAVTYLLNKTVQMWVAAGIVAVALLVLAAILALVGKSRLSAANLKPEQTIESLKEDREWAKHQISSVKR